MTSYIICYCTSLWLQPSNFKIHTKQNKQNVFLTCSCNEIYYLTWSPRLAQGYDPP